MKLSSTDQAAVAVLVSGASEQEKQANLNALLKQSREAHGLQCEECGAANVSDNGCSGPDLTFLCEDCGHQWSPNV